jgi:hypothetical protein
LQQLLQPPKCIRERGVGLVGNSSADSGSRSGKGWAPLEAVWEEVAESLVATVRTGGDVVEEIVADGRFADSSPANHRLRHLLHLLIRGSSRAHKI